MQGGCLCENLPNLRLDTNNVELAATIAPRPLLMISAMRDWTNETMDLEFPAMRRLYELAGAPDRVHAVQFEAPHNDNRDSREAMYAWMARWLKGAPPDARIEEQPFTPEPVPDALVFFGRPLPEGALAREQLVDRWIGSSKQQLEGADPQTLANALTHALAVERPRSDLTGASSKRVLLAGTDPELEKMLARSGYSVSRVAATGFDEAAAARVQHFDTYNRTLASQRVADIVRDFAKSPAATLVATSEWGPAAILAAAVLPLATSIVDVDRFDNSTDDDFLERLYIPGLRRAGDLQTAVSMAKGRVIIHNAGGRTHATGARVEARRLTNAEILQLARQGAVRSASFVSRAKNRPTIDSRAATDR